MLNENKIDIDSTIKLPTKVELNEDIKISGKLTETESGKNVPNVKLNVIVDDIKLIKIVQ